MTGRTVGNRDENWPPGPALLFCPADRPDRYAKAAAAADVVVIDLEDGVAPANKEAARHHLRAALEAGNLERERLVVRLNPAETDDHERDLVALEGLDVTTVMLAKAERADHVRALAPRRVIALCETARGVLAAPGIAREAETLALMWGAEDLVVSLGGRSSRHPTGPRAGTYRDIARHARTTVLLAAGAGGVTAIDAVHLDIADRDGLVTECEDAAASGFAAKACIHPGQAAIVRAAFAPSPEQADWARRVLAAAQNEAGVFAFEGRMVDQPILDQARRMLTR
jgi:citrate lyase subunit beta / citryl-CoA lyase